MKKNIQKQTQNIHQNADTKVITSRTIYSGPLPPASELQKYAEISPDIPNRIINMAEDDLKHIHSLKLNEQKYIIKMGYLGWGSGIVITLILAFFAFYLALNDKNVGAIIAFIGTMSPIATIYYLNKRDKKS